MQVIYAAPFILLSVAAFLACLAVPRLRQHALQALVIPVAFGACSIIASGLLASVLAVLNDRFGLTQPYWGQLTVLACTYVGFGAAGAWAAVRLVRRFVRRMNERS